MAKKTPITLNLTRKQYNKMVYMAIVTMGNSPGHLLATQPERFTTLKPYRDHNPTEAAQHPLCEWVETKTELRIAHKYLTAHNIPHTLLKDHAEHDNGIPLGYVITREFFDEKEHEHYRSMQQHNYALDILQHVTNNTENLPQP